MPRTSDDEVFLRAESLVLLAVNNPEFLPAYESIMAQVSNIEGVWKVKNKQSQNDKILSHLKAGRSISPLEAMGVFGIYRLAARIFELRQDGHVIQKQIKDDGQGRTYAEYSLI